jgi:hypothetical protein
MRLSMRKLLAIAVLGVLSVAALAAYGGSSSSSSRLVVGEGSGRFLSERFSDWVSYADQLSIVSVIREEELAADNGTFERGEGYIGRAATLRVERTLWRRAGAPSAADTIRVITYGWVLQDWKRHSFAGWGGPRLEVGGRYLTPLVRAPRDGADWTPLSVESTLPLAGSSITTTGIVGLPSPIAKSMNGKSPEALAQILAHTQPDPIAAKYWNLGPDERVHAVLRARGGTG